MPTANLRPTELAGLLWTWWRGDRLASLPPLASFRVTTSPTEAVLAALTGLTATEVAARIEAQHQPYIAWIERTPVAYGWCASARAIFGAPPVTFDVPPGNRYLKDFATLPSWRGCGIYPRLLQAIIATETGADRFWILHRHDNCASARGIEKAGFTRVAHIHFLEGGGLGLVSTKATERCVDASQVFSLPVVKRKRSY